MELLLTHVCAVRIQSKLLVYRDTPVYCSGLRVHPPDPHPQNRLDPEDTASIQLVLDQSKPKATVGVDPFNQIREV